MPEFVLENTNFFEIGFDKKLISALEENQFNFNKEMSYELIINYCYSPIQYSKSVFCLFTTEEDKVYKSFNDFVLPEFDTQIEYINNKKFGIKNMHLEDKVHKAISIQNEEIINEFRKMNIYLKRLAIRGDSLRSIVDLSDPIMEIQEYVSVEIKEGKKRTKSDYMCRSIAADIRSVMHNMGKVKSEDKPIEENRRIPEQKYNLNTCKYREISWIPGMSTRIYDGILLHREEKTFESVDELKVAAKLSNIKFMRLKEYFEV